MDLRLSELASLLDISETTIEKWSQEGVLPCYRIQDEFRFNREEIEDWLLHHRQLVSKESVDNKDNFFDHSLKYSLYRAIHKGGVICDVAFDSKEEVLRYGSSYIAQKFQLDEGVLFEMLCHRERLMSTGIGEGIALPHAKDFLLSSHYDLVVPMFLPKSVDFESLDGKPVDILFFLLASQDKRHLNLINKIVHLGMSLEARSFLKTCPNQEELLDFVKNWESRMR